MAALIPFKYRYFNSNVYRQTCKQLLYSQYWSLDQHVSFQIKLLKELVEYSYHHVPYYASLFNNNRINSNSFTTLNSLSTLPFLDKIIVRNNIKSLTSTAYSARKHKEESTGGTDGTPMQFLSLLGYTNQREAAFWHTMLGRVGFVCTDWKIELRNASLPRGDLFDYDPMRRKLVLDPFKMNPSNIDEYVNAVRASKARILHTYPSAVCLFINLASSKCIDVKGIVDIVFATSENVYPGQREYVENLMDARFFSFYGHSEKLVMAGECECSSDYHVQTEYGILELIDKQGEQILEPGIRGEIVATGFNNPLMPMIRYRTGDYAEWAHPGPCACGRHYPRITNVAGRWLQEMVYGRSGTQISMTGLNMHSDILKNVCRYQFEQFEVGSVILKVIPSEHYDRADDEHIRAALQKKLGSELDLIIQHVKDIPVTCRGKHRMLVQHVVKEPLSCE
jgi:phenylacetate-CoA ligase